MNTTEVLNIIRKQPGKHTRETIWNKLGNPSWDFIKSAIDSLEKQKKVHIAGRRYHPGKPKAK